jgi:hypothetical protein
VQLHCGSSFCFGLSGDSINGKGANRLEAISEALLQVDVGCAGSKFGIAIDDCLDDDQSFDGCSAKTIYVLPRESANSSEVQVQTFESAHQIGAGD